MWCQRAAIATGLLLLGAACATPVGVTPGSTQDVYRSLTSSVLSTGRLTAQSEQTLRRRGLDERFATEPEAVIAELRGDGTGLSRDRLFTLAELSFFHAEHTSRHDYYLAAAVYAYAFMMQSRGTTAVAIDPRARVAAELYNLGLVRGLALPPPEPPLETATAAGAAPPAPAAPPVTEVDITQQTRPLPFGQLDLKANPDDWQWGGYRMARFVAVGDFQVRGLRNRYRQAGLGAPLAAELTPLGTGAAAERARRHIAPRTKVPVTAIVRFDDIMGGIATGRLVGHIALYAADQTTTFEVDGRTLPLQLEPSATLAYQLEAAPLWQSEIRGFLSSSFRILNESLFMMYPYRPGRVPVVLIHGTASSPARWADLVNEIQNDAALRDRVQLWVFMYNTSNPILLSAAELRRSLQELVNDLDPERRDPALREMVLIGHSQGGLLARLMVTHSGTAFWDNVSHVPFAQAAMSPQTKSMVQQAMFFEPLPFVTRVVFVATPHHGSFRVSSLILGLVRRIVSLPAGAVAGAKEAAEQGLLLSPALAAIPTAVDNMRPGHQFVRTLSSLPIANGVTAHSIIAVWGKGPPSRLNDGVVAYTSAHIDGVASEKIVHSRHSTQSHPETILEIERILREHVGEVDRDEFDDGSGARARAGQPQ